MRPSPYSPSKWRSLIPDIDEVIKQMEQSPIVAVGITPYTRVVPGFFLKNFSIYTIKRSADVASMEQFVRMHVLEDRNPEIANKIHGTGYLIGNYMFQSFIKSRKVPAKLMFYTMTEKIAQDLERLGIESVANHPKTFESVMYKGAFRELVKSLGLPSLPSYIYARDEFLSSPFEDLWKRCGGAFVVQRADKETGGNEGTYFIHDEADFRRTLKMLSSDTSFERLVVTHFIEGESTSMLGCVMENGTLSGPLQLQLIDVPESLHGVPPNGIFFGNDLGFNKWDAKIEETAQKVVEAIGEHLRAQGYKGIFGIDFLFDRKRNEIYPNECNPRFTGSLVLYSLACLEHGVPPLEFFHLMAHLNIKSDFDFEKVNQALKFRLPFAHIAFSPKGITSMELKLPAGVYSYDKTQNPPLSYKGVGASLADLKDKRDFLVIDTVPALHASIEQNVPRLFKFIFPRSIAHSSYKIDKEAGYLLEKFAGVLLEAAQKAAPKKETAPHEEEPG